MKIAVASSVSIPSMWAHGINTVKHAQGFLDLGHEIELLIVQRLKEVIFEFTTSGIHQFYDISPKVRIKRFYERPFSFFSLTPIFKALVPRLLKLFPFEKKILSPEEKIVRYLKANQFDLLYTRSYRIAYYGIKYKIPTILETHATDLSRKILQKVFQSSLNKNFLGIVTIHQSIKRKQIEQGVPEQKIVVIEDAVDIKKFDKIKLSKHSLRNILKIPQEKFIILYAGSLKSGKGIEEIINVAKLMQDPFLFYIVGGSRGDVQKWEKIVRKFAIRNIKFTSFVPPPLIPLYLKSADVLILLFNPKEKNKIMDIDTTSPIKLFEYMASKKPLISSKIPTIEKILESEKEALLSPIEDYSLISEFLKSLQKDSSLRDKLAENAYHKVLDFTYKRRCEKILSSLYFQP